jgi:hypothetical protein
MGITYYTSNPIPIEYTEEEMKKKVLEFIINVDGEFSFRSLSNFIVQTAMNEQRVKDAAHTQYSSDEMDPFSSILLSKILWGLIWDKKVFIAFGENPYMAHYVGDTRFVAVKEIQ